MMLHISITSTLRKKFPLLFLALTTTLLLISNEVEAGKNYYFSSSTGDDSRTYLYKVQPHHGKL